MIKWVRGLGALLLTIQIVFSFAHAAFADNATPEYVGPDQSTATLKETLDWIRIRVPQLCTLKDGGCPYNDITFEWLELKNCDRWSFGEIDHSGTLWQTFTFSPQTLEASSARVSPLGLANPECSMSEYAVDVETLGKAKSVTETVGNTWQVDGVRFVFVDHESAERLAKALKHAIRLCGSKKEPF
jgi:hypothetical protein